MNKIIKANAGAGKTYALVRRMVAAMRAGTAAREIVALTFSRAAAGEIFSRFVQRLAQKKEYAFLREVIETQHLSLIGTLDSFLMRYLQSFPLELGLAGDIAILEDYAGDKARESAALSLLSSDDDVTKKLLVANFRIWDSDEASRSYLEKYKALVKEWHAAYLARRDPYAWGDAARVWPDGAPAELAATLDEIHRLADPIRERCAGMRGVDNFVLDVETFSGKKLPRNIPAAIVKNPDAFEAAARAVRLAKGYMLATSLEKAKGVYALVHFFEKEYDRTVRSRGRITFQDITRRLADLALGDKLALEYRLDARIVHWALDEFQDTSRDQWGAIENLVHEARQRKSVFIVGDKKQAIYGWRSGDERIFDEEGTPDFYHLLTLKNSYRYRKEISSAVDCVFNRTKLGDIAPEWPCEEHISEDRISEGFVHIVEAPKSSAQSRPVDFIAPLANELNAVRPWERGLSCAILVRKNTFGEMIANELLRSGIPVVWEGQSAILDTPVLNAFVALVRLAEHPGDELSFGHIKATPLYRALYPASDPDMGEVARDAARMLTTLGLQRMLREVRRAIKPDEWDEFTESRFADLVRAAARFEASLAPDSTYGEFADYLKSVTKREVADTASVRILTIHRSKGLTFDYVLVPVYEHEGLETLKSDVVASDSPSWVLPGLKSDLADLSPETERAYRDTLSRAVSEALCVWYVAMTRPRYALTLVVPPAPKKPGAVKFSTLVRTSGLETMGDERWYEKFEKRCQCENVAKSNTNANCCTGGPRLSRPPDLRTITLRVRSAAAERGVAEHERLSKIEWLDAADAKTPLEKELVKRDGVFELWRERAYEIFDGGVWSSGRFDRVEFSRDAAGAVFARIIDFKTNSPRDGESPEAFASRMDATYAGQMARYRRAVHLLTGIPPERISSRLLMVERLKS